MLLYQSVILVYILGWETKTWKFPETCRPASLVYTATNSKPYLKVKQENHHQRLSSDLHMCNKAPPPALTRTYHTPVIHRDTQPVKVTQGDLVSKEINK